MKMSTGFDEEGCNMCAINLSSVAVEKQPVTHLRRTPIRVALGTYKLRVRSETFRVMLLI